MAAISFLTLTTLFALVSSQEMQFHDCYPNYRSDSLYRVNYLDTLLPSLSSNIGDDGFYAASDGLANAIVLCRGDLQLEECRSCVSIIANEIVQLCGNQMRAIRWHMNCTLRYSDEPMLGTMSTIPNTTVWSEFNVTSPDKFKEELGVLMDDLRAEAAYGGSRLKAAAGNRSGPDGQTIYGMSQCTPDLSNRSCDSCLSQAAQLTPAWYPIGARVYTPSCIIRYEISPFYNITRLQEPRDQPRKPSSSGKKKDGNKTRNIIIIAVVSCLVLVVCIGIFARKIIRKQKPKQNPETADDTSSIDSIQYDFEKIRAATNDFSDANKLGQGGFGAVYWGKLVNGEEIAVKRLSRNSSQGDVEFKNEVLLLVKLQHKNLVRLLGFSTQGPERLLAWRNWHEGTTENVIDPVLRATSSSQLDMLRCVHIALLCVQENAADRPTMSSVVLMLNSSSLTLSIPSQPAFYLSNSRTWELRTSSRRRLGQPASNNEVSISEFGPR
ncbi:Cysteine-rich receptor-like protein kinase [Sesamum alatum]|uniref:Cysteine-rich receptor-like protein kinase n=1 Tax=Sesamum alatum TaxID=300844 RepID=A0AAE2CNF0_9LAMI|nr:Cysteine-rich receptor-like protein kinase [Sesamum alatum]